jgi:hypothetical protein
MNGTPQSSFVDLRIVEYIASLFSGGLRGRGVTIMANGAPRLWLFGEQSIVPWW